MKVNLLVLWLIVYTMNSYALDVWFQAFSGTWFRVFFGVWSQVCVQIINIVRDSVAELLVITVQIYSK